jgi:hypothetical protein
MANRLNVQNIYASDSDTTAAVQVSGANVTLNGTANDLGTVTAGTLGPGVVFPAGHVLQVKQGTHSTATSTTSTSFVDTGLSASITPSSTSNKIAVIVFQPMFISQANSTTAWYFIQLLRDSTFLTKQHNQFDGASTGQYTLPSHISFLDSPGTTSSVTYKTQCMTYNGSNTIYLSWDTGVSSIILMEIAA